MIETFTAPKSALSDPKLSPAAFRVLCLVCAQADEAPTLKATQSELGEALGISRSTTQRALNLLKECGYIDWENQHKGACLFRLLWRAEPPKEVIYAADFNQAIAHLDGRIQEMTQAFQASQEEVSTMGERLGSLFVLVNTMRADFPFYASGGPVAGKETGEVVDPDSSAAARALVDAASRLFSVHGFAKVTTANIAAAAQVAESTLFRIFGNKVGLLASAAKDAALRLDQALNIETSDDMRVDLELLAERYWRYWFDNPYDLMLVFEANREELSAATYAKEQMLVGARLAKIYAAHRAYLDLPPDYNDMQAEHELSIGFLGPIFAQFIWSAVEIDTGEFDAAAHVDRFLAGYGKHEGER